MVKEYKKIPNSDKVVCETPTPGKKPTGIDQWKYDLLRNAILEVLPKQGNGVPFGDLANLIKDCLGSGQLSRLGSLAWYTTAVKLDMEVKEDNRRVSDSNPQRLLRVK
jgi:hypothetical protein